MKDEEIFSKFGDESQLYDIEYIDLTKTQLMTGYILVQGII